MKGITWQAQGRLYLHFYPSNVPLRALALQVLISVKPQRVFQKRENAKSTPQVCSVLMQNTWTPIKGRSMVSKQKPLPGVFHILTYIPGCSNDSYNCHSAPTKVSKFSTLTNLACLSTQNEKWTTTPSSETQQAPNGPVQLISCFLCPNTEPRNYLRLLQNNFQAKFPPASYTPPGQDWWDAGLPPSGLEGGVRAADGGLCFPVRTHTAQTWPGSTRFGAKMLLHTVVELEGKVLAPGLSCAWTDTVGWRILIANWGTWEIQITTRQQFAPCSRMLITLRDLRWALKAQHQNPHCFYLHATLLS